jgi:hypothetical protein
MSTKNIKDSKIFPDERQRLAVRNYADEQENQGPGNAHDPSCFPLSFLV